jgi:hypothetical protein
VADFLTVRNVRTSRELCGWYVEAHVDSSDLAREPNNGVIVIEDREDNVIHECSRAHWIIVDIRFEG